LIDLTAFEIKKSSFYFMNGVWLGGDLGEIQTKIREIQTIKNRFFVWISPIFYLDFSNLLFGFPGFLT
jgi:hypothetical protein